LFELMESNADALLKTKDLSVLAEVVRQSVAIKARVVLQDEHEAGLRSILNFGHSIGHAIEALSLPHLLHGECVAIGMMEEILLARSYGLVGSGVLRRVDNILKAFSLPTKVPAHLSPKDLLDKMSIDKKNKNGKKELVMLTGIGSVKSSPKYTTMIPDEHLHRLLSPSIGVSPCSGPIRGELAVPGSKSLSNRVLLLAALGRGPCTIRGLLHSQDTQVMLDSLSQLGVKYSWEDGLKLLVIQGCAGQLRNTPTRPLFLNNAGTASRFLTSVVCLLKSPEGSSVELTGNARMQERPIKDLVSALRSTGAEIAYIGAKEGCFPIKVTTGNGRGLRGGEVRLAANISSQFVSSILLAAVHASGDEDLVLTLDTSSGAGSVVSKPFIDMTVQLMRQFGINVVEEAPFRYRVARGVYDNPPEVQVEGDASSATYPLALAAVSGGEVTVTNVGSDSLQGDAKFCQVLAAMGCRVTQTPTSTTVRGPDFSKGEFLRALPEQDMDALTDTFMTLAAVASFARGTTRITNVANQRVKECNRLAVMVSELGKLGIQVRESETGIDVEGVGGVDEAALAPLRAHMSRAHAAQSGLAVIACHDDHRIAMSLAVVGSRLGGVVLDEKRCVDKTYPEFWEDCETKLGMHFFAPDEAVMAAYEHGAQAQGSAAASSSSSSADVASEGPSVVLVGMRGSAKSTLGLKLASSHLRRRFVDLDAVLETQLGCTLKDFVEKEGWEKFRQRELEVLTASLNADTRGCVISCGGGVVETPAALASLKSFNGPVVQLRRDIDDVVSYLDQDQSRPGFDARAVWAKRQPLYEQASHYEFVMQQGDGDWPRIEADFFAFIDSIIGAAPRLEPVPNTFFLSLTLPSLPGPSSSSAEVLAAAEQQVREMSVGVDAIEVRVDLITSTFDANKIKQYVSALRRLTRLPLIYTVRSKKQGGQFVDYEGQDAASNEVQMVRALELGMRLGCEVVDIEANLSASARAQLYSLRAKSYPRVQIISSHHEPQSGGGSSVDEVKRLFERCAQAAGSSPSKPEIVKVVVKAVTEVDSFRLLQAAGEVQRDFAASATASHAAPAVIALAMGPLGRSTRVYNRVLTPVTHPALPSAAAPGQLSVAQIMSARRALTLQPFDSLPASGQRQWLLFGKPITHSPSPLLHNTAFRWLGVSDAFSYGKLETDSVEAVKAALAQPDFGGSNVTIPLKEVVAPLLHSTSEAVKRIGAVNTIVRSAEGTLHGDNTDWQGIRSVLLERLPRSKPRDNDVAVVLGAGGTARAAIFALQQMRFASEHIVLFNPRTKERAKELAAEFGVKAVEQLTRAQISAATGLQQVRFQLEPRRKRLALLHWHRLG
jgi:pentafunctional AROM polypeptide